MAKRLSSIVAEVIIDDKSAKPDVAVSALLDGLKNKPLTSDCFVGLLLHVARSTRPAGAGIRLSAIRDLDLNGVSIAVNLLTTRKESEAVPGTTTEKQEDDHEEGESDCWRNFELVTLGAAYLHNVTGIDNSLGDLKQYEFLVAAINEALDAPPDLPFTIKADLVREP